MLIQETEFMVNKSVVINAPVFNVWKALTNAELIQQWVSDEEVTIVSEWKIGQSFTYRGLLHGRQYENKGTILQFDPERILEYTMWSSLSEQADTPENHSVVKFVLVRMDNKTLLTVTQHNFIAETTYQHWRFYWSTTLDIIKRLVEQ